MDGASETGEPKQTFLNKLEEFAEAAPVHIGRFFNSAFKLVLGGTAVERIIRELRPTVEAINALEPEMLKLSDTALAAKTDEFRNRLASGETVDDLLVEAFAVVREAARRLEGTPYPKRHYDVQLVGGVVLHKGKIAEMITGEGKTLVATLAAYLNALPGDGVHVVTVNDYLARRDAAWMSPVYEFLGLSVGAIQSDMDPNERAPIYASDIVYGTNNEFGFDYLRDNMKLRVEDQVQRKLNYAIIDEVDSALIDEARTPLIISGGTEGSTEKYYVANRAAQRLRKGPHYEVREKEHAVLLTEEGIIAAQRHVGVTSFYSGRNVDWPHYMDNALKAKELYRLDHHYVVRDGEVLIVDEFTGRLMPGRRWSDGLHQAVEAKENLHVQEENQTLATITFQNFFRLYQKLAGMTGTALTEAPEFSKIYNLEVVPIPPNRPLRRLSHPDVIYATDKEKVSAIVDEIAETSASGRPTLVGTISVERSEMLAERLKRRGIKHVVLNAKHHKRESAVVAQAGEPGAVTMATNMAGRGTDIVLGGNPALALQAELETRWDKTETEAMDLINVFRNAQRFVEQAPTQPTLIPRLPGLDPETRLMWDPGRSPGENIETIAAAMDIELPADLAEKLLAKLSDMEDRADAAHDKIVAIGGLHIVGTERHEARRIDNQLRGRAGRQGDPGSSRFFLSLEDDLMRIFMTNWVRRFMQKAGLRDGQQIESKMVSRAIGRAQKKVEEQNFAMRKHLLEYDGVMDEQRKLVYGERQAVLEAFRERPADEVAAEVIAEFVAPEWLDGEGVELRRSFRPAQAAVQAAAGVTVTEEHWRQLGFREFCEQAATDAPGGRPNDDEVLAVAVRAVSEAVGDFASRRRGAPDEQRARAKELGFGIDRSWPEEFGALFVARLAQAVEPAATPDIVRDWARRGLNSDRIFLASEKWDYETFQKWIGALPCQIGGAEWPALLSRPEKIEPLVAERLAEGFGAAPAGEVITALVTASARLYLGSGHFFRNPSAERLSRWVDYRFGVTMSAPEITELADQATRRMAEAAAAAKAEQLGLPDGVALYWHYPAVVAAVKGTLGAEKRDLAGLCERLEEDYRVGLDPFELGKLNGERIRQTVAEAIDASGTARIACSGLDQIISRTLQNVVDQMVDEYVDPEQSPEERSFGPFQRWAAGLGLEVTREEWSALSRDELTVVLGNQVRELPDDEAREFARRCIRSSVDYLLSSEAFAEDQSYTHLAAWARGRFSFASSPVKLETALPRKVDARRGEARQQLIDEVLATIQAEELEQAEIIDRLIPAALRAYFITHVGTEEIALEPLARWVNSKLHVSAPAARMQEMMEIEERTIIHFASDRAQGALARQKPDRIVSDVVNAAADCFLPPETLPGTWGVAEMDEWLKQSGLSEEFDPYKLADDAHTDLVEVFVEAAEAGYGERTPSALAVDAVRHAADTFLDSDLSADRRDIAGLADKFDRKFGAGPSAFELSKLDAAALRARLDERAREALARRTRQVGRRQLHWVARVLILQAIDTRWKDHLAAMDSLKEGIGMRGYAQVDPKLAYKKEGYEAFEIMIAAIQEEVSDLLLKVEIDVGTEVQEEQEEMRLLHSSTSAYEQAEGQAVAAGASKSDSRRPVRADREPSRNAPCPCGSGKKYKNCCMGKA